MVDFAVPPELGEFLVAVGLGALSYFLLNAVRGLAKLILFSAIFGFGLWVYVDGPNGVIRWIVYLINLQDGRSSFVTGFAIGKFAAACVAAAFGTGRA